MTDWGTTRRSVEAAVCSAGATGSGPGSMPADGQHLAAQRLGGVGDDGVLAEELEEGGVADGALGEDGRDAVEALELGGLLGLGGVLVVADLGPLLTHEQGDDLELRADRGGGDRAPLHGGLDLAHRAGEHGDDARRRRWRGPVVADGSPYGARRTGAGLVEPRDSSSGVRCHARRGGWATARGRATGRATSKGRTGRPPRDETRSHGSARDRRAGPDGPSTMEPAAIGRWPATLLDEVRGRAAASRGGCTPW